MKKLLVLCLSIGSFISLTQAQATLIEKVDAKPGKLIVPYQKFQYPNGLTLMVSEDHSDPVTHLNVTYHVGSARETRGKSGFAHFFEHMLFQGSKHIADEEHFKIIKNYGGDVNGNTTRDRTVYIETFPSNFTETALWMEADRMGFFLEAFTNKKFEIQRSTVKNEKAERYDAPYGFLMEVKDQELYPKEHPYSWSTIGFVDDLDRADSNDLKNFFLRWYSPNNACIIVSGDVNTSEVVAWVDKFFGAIQRGPEVKKQAVPRVKLLENKVATYPDANAYVPLIYSTFVGVPVGHADEAALDVLTYLMGGTRSSTLYKKFVDAEWALQADASNNPLSSINHELAGEISFTVVGYPYSDVPRLQKMMKSAIDSFGIIGFSDEDLDRAKTNILSNYSSGLEDVSTKANYLSSFWYLDAKNADGSSYNLEDDASRYRNLTKADIMRVYNMYLKNKFSSTVIITPSQVAEGEEKPKYQSVNPNAGFTSALADAEYKGLSPRPVKDNFDRSVRPQPKEITSAKSPKVAKKVLDNGLEIWSTYFDETPRVIVQLNIEGGRLLEDGKVYPAGTAEMTASAMNTGTSTKTPEDLEKEFEKLGINIGFGGGSTGTSITLSCEKDKLDAAIVLLQEMMFKPRWDESEFKKAKKQVKEGAKSSLTNRGTGASNAYRRLMNGENALGTALLSDDYDKVSMENCKAYYAANYVPNLTKMVVVGPVSEDEIYTKFAFLNSWQKKSVTITTPVAATKMGTPQIFGVKYNDAEQSDIFLGFKSQPYDYAGKFFQNNIMNFALAGNFNSRLNLNIREDKAWTYGIRGGYSPAYKDMPGTYTISAGVKARATDSAIIEIVDELVRYKNGGITDEEFNFTKSALIASESLEYESIGQKAGYILQMANRNLPMDYADQQLKVLQSITKEQINTLAKEEMNLENLTVVVAGDIIDLQPKLDALGMGKIQMLEPTGAGKIKYMKPGTTSLPRKKVQYNPPADLRK